MRKTLYALLAAAAVLLILGGAGVIVSLASNLPKLRPVAGALLYGGLAATGLVLILTVVVAVQNGLEATAPRITDPTGAKVPKRASGN
jgi:hypothetical protein